jgi:hypothetical protein
MLNETSCKLIYKDMMKYINMGYEKVVILVVLTTLIFSFSLPISHLMAKAIPVREPNLKTRLRQLKRVFAFMPSHPLLCQRL